MTVRPLDAGDVARPARLRAGTRATTGPGSSRCKQQPPGRAGPDHDAGLRVLRHRAVPGPGDGPGREDHQRRGHPGRARHLQPAAAGGAGALGHPLHRADLRRRAARVAAPAGGDRAARSASTIGGRRRGERARGRARRRPDPRGRSPRPSTTSVSASPRPRSAAFEEAPEVALVSTHPAYEARTAAPAGRARRAARRPPGDNKGPPYRLTRDNSVRESLQTLGT